jgi:hypothetical protein
MSVGESPFVELRVHGVAGTPPESMLGLGAVPLDPPADECGKAEKADITVYGPPDVAPTTRAFSWSSMTSGSALMALWILLLPYMLANVAGWAMVPLESSTAQAEGAPRPWPIRFVAFFVRLGGLLVTAIFVLFALLMLADLVGFQRFANEKWWAPGAGVAAAAGLLGVLYWFTRVRLREEWKARSPWADDAKDPVGYAWLASNQARMWNSPGIIVRLRRLHLAWGLGLVALVSMCSLRALDVEWGATDGVVASFAIAATVLPVLLLALVCLSDGHDLRRTTFWIRWGAWSLALVAVAGAVWRFLVASPAPTEAERFLPSIRGAGACVAALLAVAVGAGAFIAGRSRGSARAPRWAAWNQPALLLTGATVGALFGAGVAVQVARAFGDAECKNPGAADCKLVIGTLEDWIATVFTLMLAVLILVLGVRLVLAMRDLPADQRLLRAVRALAQNVSTILATLGGIGIAGLLVAFVLGWRTGFGDVTPPPWVTIPAVILVLAPVAVAAFLACAKLGRAGIVVGAALIAIVAWVLVAGKSFRFADVTLPPQTFLAFARGLALTLPTALVLSRLVAAVRNREARRGVAVLWDLGNFWPRWFHPFAPPTYSDTAVTKLRNDVRDGLAAGTRVLLAPHSQGSIIASASVTYLDGPSERLALLTYGSPLSRLYPQVFPAVYTKEMLEAMCDRLSGDGDATLRWKNLWRSSDPIGGPIEGSPTGMPAGWKGGVDVEVEVRCGRNHSDYPVEPEYTEAAQNLRDLIS